MNTKNNGRPRTTKPERFHHLRDVEIEYESGRIVGNVTAFVREADDGKLYASYAECDTRDQFDRKRGRTVARRKWFVSRDNRYPVASAKFEDVFTSEAGYAEFVKPAAVACASC